MPPRCRVLLALCACGFRLAGSEPLPAVMARPYLSLKDPYTDFSREFEHQLKSSGAPLQAVREDATATIEVTKDLVEQRTLAVSATNIPTEYELTYTVTFAVQGPDKQLLAPQTISLSKDLQLRCERAARQGARGGYSAPANGARSGRHRDAPADELEVASRRRSAVLLLNAIDRLSLECSWIAMAWSCTWWRPRKSFPARTGASARRA